MSKTGTTSLKKAFQDLGYRVGSETAVYPFYQNYAVRDFKPLIEHCKTAQVFEDELFGLPYTFQALDSAFPGSKFILTVRDDEKRWYDSFINHHIRKFGKNGHLPTSEENETFFKAEGLNRLEYMRIRFDAPADDLFNEEILKEAYLEHNKTVCDYFRYRDQDLLVINLSDKKSYHRFCNFIDRKPIYEKFPHLNKGSDITGSRR